MLVHPPLTATPIATTPSQQKHHSPSVRQRLQWTDHQVREGKGTGDHSTLPKDAEDRECLIGGHR